MEPRSITPEEPTGLGIRPRASAIAAILRSASPQELAQRSLSDSAYGVRLDAVIGGSCVEAGAALLGKSVLIYTSDQFHAALAMLELDGVARRVILCPPDLPPEHLPHVISVAEVDAVVADRPLNLAELQGPEHFLVRSSPVASIAAAEVGQFKTEWVLLTSGTTGVPKLVVHTLASLAGAIPVSMQTSKVVWSTFYDIRRYGGLQIFLRAMLTGASLALSDARESTSDFLARAGKRGVTHISGTPSHWRHALMSPAAREIAPEYVRMSGEIADQAIINHLQAAYSPGRVAHAFASTEGGLAFEVNDGLEGFPSGFIGGSGEVEMKVEDGSLRIRSPRIASRYLGGESLTDAGGFVDTRDIVELRGDRYYFTGRRDGVINIGGMKVHPEEVEAVINRHPRVRMSLVYTRKNPIMGAIVAADVVLEPGIESSKTGLEAVQSEIMRHCRTELASHKVPVALKFVNSLQVAESGKLIRTPCAT